MTQAVLQFFAATADVSIWSFQRERIAVFDGVAGFKGNSVVETDATGENGTLGVFRGWRKGRARPVLELAYRELGMATRASETRAVALLETGKKQIVFGDGFWTNSASIESSATLMTQCTR